MYCPRKYFKTVRFFIFYTGFLVSFYCRFQQTWERAVPKFVANLPITFPSSKIGRELRNKVCKFISMFELLETNVHQAFWNSAISRNCSNIAEFREIQFKSRNLNFGKVNFFIFPLNSQKDKFV